VSELVDEDSPYRAMGGQPVLLRLANRFYDLMQEREPALAAIHKTDELGRISQESREAFFWFLSFWTGGPDDYLELHGHPRLRMRHAHLSIGPEMRDAWLRCMTAALDECGVSGDVRELLDARFKHVAHFLQNR
jgi:hemoglobin